MKEPRIQHDRTDAELYALRFEPTLRIQMFGLAYVNEERSHGVRKGEQAARGVSWALDDLDPLTNPHPHIEQLCRVASGNRKSIGIFGRLVIGPQAPTGSAGLAEGAGAG